MLPFLPALQSQRLSINIAVEELPTGNGPADYALFVSGHLLGIIEAKKVTVNPQNVLEQAKRYARGVFDAVGEWNGLRVPFLYASNGTKLSGISTRDQTKLVSRQLSDFHTLRTPSKRDSPSMRQPREACLLDTPPEQIGKASSVSTRLHP